MFVINLLGNRQGNIQKGITLFYTNKIINRMLEVKPTCLELILMAIIRGRTYNHDSSVLLGGATVRLYLASTGALEQETTSTPYSGDYSFTVADAVTKHYVVAFRESFVKAGIVGPVVGV